MTTMTWPKLEVLIGMVASGKSTYARRRAGEGALVISHDDLTAMLHASYRYEPGLRECYRRMEESLAWAALNIGRDVVVDRTHLTRESRQRWVRWASNYDFLQTFDGHGPTTRVVAVAFPIASAEEHAYRRANHDARGRTLAEWHKVAEHHAAQAAAEPLDASEGFAEIIWPEG